MAAIVTLALAVGANTAMFSVLQGLVLRSLPFPHANQLVMLWTERPSQGVLQGRSAFLTIQDWRQRGRSFTDLAFFDPGSATLESNGEVEQASIGRISPNLFSVLGVPVRGRSFSWEEADARQSVAVISRRYWLARFGGSDTALGSTIHIDGRAATVVGIVPDDLPFAEATVWEPHSLVPGWDGLRNARGIGPWFAIGRLQRGMSAERARLEMTSRAHLDALGSAIGPGASIGVMPLDRYVVGARPRLALWLLTGAVFAVLLVAATNVAGLLLSRGAARERELAIRSALGASRARIVRQLLAESLMLAVIASLVGVTLAVGALRLILAIAPPNLPRLAEVRLDLWTLGWTGMLALVITVLTGLAPALTTTGRNLTAATRESGRGVVGSRAGQRIRRGLVRAQLSAVVVLLVAAGLLLRSLWSVSDVDRGFNADGVLMLQVASQRPPVERVDQYFRMLEQVVRVPGVTHAGMTGDLIISGGSDVAVTIDGAPTAEAIRLPIRRDEASPDLFAALDVSIVNGRAFDERDGRDGRNVAIVNEVLAQRLWPPGTAVGRRFKLGPVAANAPWFTVVGVVADMRRQGQETAPVAQMFEPLAQNSSRLATLVVKTSQDDPTSLAGAIRSAIRQVDPRVPIYGVTSLDERLGAMGALREFQTYLLVAFAAVALLLTTVGAYGLIRHSVASRTQEIAVRMAMGAEARAIFGMVIREGLRLCITGLAVGLVGSLAVSRLGTSLLYGVTPTDPWTFLAVSGLLVGVTMAACWIPARRAMTIDPVTALRR
jgi:putative ABC transport system permease protein